MTARSVDPRVSFADGARWLSYLLFTALASAILVASFELPHYGEITGAAHVSLDVWSRLAFAWVLWAKSLLPILPLFAIAAALTAFGRHLLGRLILGAGTLLSFAWLVADLWVQVRFGGDAASYLPFLTAALPTRGGTDHLQWAGDPTAIVFGLLTTLGLAAAGAVALRTFVNVAIPRALQRSRSLPRITGAMTLIYAMAVLAAIPGQSLIHPPAVRMALRVLLPDPFAAPFQRYGSLGERNEDCSGPDILGFVPEPWENPRAVEILLANRCKEAIALGGWELVNAQHERWSLDGVLPAGATRELTLDADRFGLSKTNEFLQLLDPNEQPRSHLGYTDQEIKRGEIVWKRSQEEIEPLLRQIRLSVEGHYREVFSQLTAPRPATLTSKSLPPRNDLPNVVLLVAESFRASAVAPDLLARLDDWSRRGLRAETHYAASNSSHRGLFALLYGRQPFLYDLALDAGLAPAATTLFRQLGYRTHFISSGSVTEWQRLSEFINEPNFDHMQVNVGKKPEGWSNWIESDRRTLESIQELISRPKGEPHFVVAFLMTTHFPYPYLEAFERFAPVARLDHFRGWEDLFAAQLDRERLWNRYRNSALSLEELLLSFLGSVDLERNVVVITGDHGESFGEDGTLVHGSRASDVQSRVPLLIAGGGIQPRSIQAPTSHIDLLPTLLHAVTGAADAAEGLSGRSLLADGRLPKQILLSPYRLRQPYPLLLIRGPVRLLLHARTDRPEIEALAFVNESGIPDPTVDTTVVGGSGPWIYGFRDEIRRMALAD